MTSESVLLLIALVSLAIVSVTLGYIVYLHQVGKKMAKSLNDVIDDYMKK